jgi:hypothetical protein
MAESATPTSAGAPSLPDAPSYTTQRPSGSPTVQLDRTTINFLSAGSGMAGVSGSSNQDHNLAIPKGGGNSSLIFAGRMFASADAADPQSDGAVRSPGKNCARRSADSTDKNGGSGWTDSLLTITSRGQSYCALGEGGFWKRGTYAAGRAFAAHRHYGFATSNSSEAIGISQGMAGGYYPYQNYTGERLATRYASDVARDALRNMFREFLPDISHVLSHH